MFLPGAIRNADDDTSAVYGNDRGCFCKRGSDQLGPQGLEEPEVQLIVPLRGGSERRDDLAKSRIERHSVLMGSKITKVRKSILLAHLSGPPRYKFLQSMDSGTDSWGEAMFSRKARSLVLILVGMLMSPSAHAQGRITTPMEQFDFNLGDDYQLANYPQLEAYWKKLAAESDRMTLEVIGYTTEGRPIHMAIITAPDNHENLGRYKEISRRLALAEGVDEEEARELSAEGRAVVWIDGGLHATETLGAQQLMEWVYQMASRTDDETMRFLRDTILLATLVNPDGLELAPTGT